MENALSRVTALQSTRREFAALEPALRLSLSDRRTTAWVACNDPTALMCLDFLASQGMAVPGEMSVVGFDDMTMAFVNNLTSYNFNSRAVMHAMVRWIIAPQLVERLGRGGDVVQVAGYVSRRGTTARARSDGD
jgi:DNA-binding LacI/PurR family transcriptional regulator